MTPEQRRVAILFIQTIADCIRDLGEVPSGHLYAHLMAMPGLSNMSASDFQALIGHLKQARLVKESNHLLTWIGPKAATR